MNVVPQITDRDAAGIDIARNTADLSRFLEPKCPATLWHRETPPECQRWLDALDPDLLPRGRVILPPHAVADAVHQLCDMSGLPDGAERDWLQGDITSLTETFSGLLSARFLRMRLGIVTTNACRKFHIDAITARLVCTYRGTGTQYGFAAKDTDPQDIFTVPTGAPVLLRGTLWPAIPPAGLLHRSPPIEGTGEARLVLVLDPVFDPDDEM